MPHFRPAFLAHVLWLVAAVAQPPARAVANQATDQQQQPQPTTLNELQGLKVTEIRIVGAAIEHPEWLLPLLKQKVNEPLDKYKVRESVQGLYNTGRFAEVQVQAERPAPGEVKLVFKARENYFFGAINVEGAPSAPSDTQLVNASKLALGEQFSEAKVQSAIEGIRTALQEGGYYEAQVEPRYLFDAPMQQVKILLVVDRGRSARVGKIVAEGYTPEEFAKVAKLHPGQRVTAGLVTRAMQRVRKNLQKKGLLEAQVTLAQHTYHPENNTLDYTFDINRGLVVDVKVEGAKLRRGQIKKLVPIYEESSVDEDLLKEGARNIQDYFQTKGYFDAKVSFTQRQSNETRQDVVFTVDKGQRYKLVSVVIQGNRYFRREDIRERLQMQTAGGLQLFGVFSQSILAHDVQSIETLYRTNGFLQVKIASDVKSDYLGKKGQIQVELSIQEGPQTTVGKLEIEGNSTISDEELRTLISASEGQPYSDATVINDQTEVMNAYLNRGFPNARFEYTAQPDAGDPNKIDLTYKISEGPQVFVNKVLIAGLHFTRPFVVDREMHLRSSGPLSQQAMLESQSGLYNLGIFNAVDMAVQNPEGETTHKNVNFQLTEARRYTFDYGFGLEVQTGQAAGPTNPQGATGVSPRVSFGVTRLNFRGRDQTVNLKLRYGNLEKLALIGFTEPHWFGWPNLTLDFTAFYNQTNDVSTFTANRLEGAAQVRQRWSRATTLLYRLIYRRVSTSNLVIAPGQVPLFSQPVRIGMPDVTYIHDTRDNPVDSHKGRLSTVDLGVASSIFGSETNFLRLTVQNSTYHPFARKRWVFARNTRIGIEEPFADTSAAVVAPGPSAPPPSSFIPLPERFFAGGATSLRGFGVNQAGPRDLATGLPLGGEALFINNLELRSPPLPLPYVGNNLSLILFNDIGNVFTTPEAMFSSIYKLKQPNRDTCLNPAVPNCNFNYTSAAVGGGIRYRTPIGPVSIDVGYNLNPPAFPVSAPIQPSPPAKPVAPFSSVLRRLNFFFNIGQTF